MPATSSTRRYDARVIDPRERHSPMSRLAAAAGLGLVMAIALAACGSPGKTSGPSAAPASTVAASPPARASAVTSSEPEAGQTDTGWGRIWDSLPTGFPAYPGSTPADEASTGPASATLAVDGDAAKSIGSWMATHLEQASYRTVELSGPLEDGSYVLESVGPAPSCRVQVTAIPLGSLTTETVMYAAACPHD
jgi:hypothetical protein